MRKPLLTVVWIALSVGLAYAEAPPTQGLADGVQFMQACEDGNAKRVAELLQANPQLMEIRQTGDEATPLHLAKNAAVAAILLNNGADIEARDKETQSTPLHWALDRELWTGKSDTAAYLLDQGANTDGILCQCALGRLDGVKALVENDPKLVDFVAHPEDQLGAMPLEVAAIYNHADVVNFLLDHGADVNPRSRQTILHEVAFLNRLEIAKLLLAHGAKLEILDSRYAESPLGWAVYAGRVEMVKFLLGRGARVRQIDLTDARTGAAGKNQAGQGATHADYLAIEALLRPRLAPATQK